MPLLDTRRLNELIRMTEAEGKIPSAEGYALFVGFLHELEITLTLVDDLLEGLDHVQEGMMDFVRQHSKLHESADELRALEKTVEEQQRTLARLRKGAANRPKPN